MAEKADGTKGVKAGSTYRDSASGIRNSLTGNANKKRKSCSREFRVMVKNGRDENSLTGAATTKIKKTKTSRVTEPHGVGGRTITKRCTGSNLKALGTPPLTGRGKRERRGSGRSTKKYKGGE